MPFPWADLDGKPSREDPLRENPSQENPFLGEPCLVAGLGNPGSRYRFTRHNVGFMVVDRLMTDSRAEIAPYGSLGWLARGKMTGNGAPEGNCESSGCESFDRKEAGGGAERSGPYFLLKPLTYMNLSGLAVGDCADRARIRFEKVLVVNDDFNLPLGRIRFRPRGSAGGHNGLKSIIRTLGTDDFPRLRIGVGPLPRGKSIVDFVLSAFEDAELSLLDKVLNHAVRGVKDWLEHRDIQRCMNRFNRAKLGND